MEQPALRRSEELSELIEEQIVTGARRPGTRLGEQDLAAEFGVSRTPIREALRSHVTVQGERFADLVASLALLKGGRPGSPGAARAPNP